MAEESATADSTADSVHRTDSAAAEVEPEPAEPAEPAEPIEPVSVESVAVAPVPLESVPVESVPEPADAVTASSAPASPAPTAPSPAAFAARPKPQQATPAALPAQKPAAPVAPLVPSTSLAEAAKFGRAEPDGQVFLILDGEELPVGQYPGASQDEALAYFVRKFDDILAQIVLLEQRVEAKAPSTDMPKTVAHLRGQLAERNAVGDVKSAEQRLDALDAGIKSLQQAERAEHDAARAVELAAREAIVAEAEKLAAQDPATMQWKTGSTRMNELFENWKTAQKEGMRLGRATEEGLWKRFRSARTVFDRHRRAFFSQLDSTNAAAKASKEKLIAEAEALSSSTDWGVTAGEYRRLMDQWKAAPRASKKEDDALWARFRAAQDAFFSARQQANEAIDAEYGANLVVKEQLIVEAKALLPIKDLAATKKALQSIRDRWEEAGKVPRNDMQRVEAGLRSVEDAVRKADDEHWKRTDPEAKARTNSALSQLEATIASLQEDLAAARSKGDAKKIKTTEEALAAREAWLDQIRRSANDLD
ncbi:MAG: DUF349 domain-containing protein [Renibacterium salmoninarum]|nr:DUF349 domain-containing protein [Renibacterium salmoninarum]